MNTQEKKNFKKLQKRPFFKHFDPLFQFLNFFSQSSLALPGWLKLYFSGSLGGDPAQLLAGKKVLEGPLRLEPLAQIDKLIRALRLPR